MPGIGGAIFLVQGTVWAQVQGCERKGIGLLVGTDRQGGVMFRPARKESPKAVR